MVDTPVDTPPPPPRTFVPYLTSSPSIDEDLEDPSIAAPAAPRAPLHPLKAAILLPAVCVVAAFAWYTLARFANQREWIVKQSLAAWLTGMATATVILSTHRRGVIAKSLSALFALGAILLGQSLVLLLPASPDAVLPRDVHAWLQLLLITNRFGFVLPLVVALTIAGSTSRFLLARPAK
jgi:hypothetical protein